MKYYRLHASLLILFITFQSVSGSNNEWIKNLYFNHYEQGNGLSHSTIIDLKQDQRGYLWIATKNGLNRYDGNRFVSYKTNANNPTTLLNNETSAIYVDSKNRLWVGSRKGVSILDNNRSSFQNFPLIVNKEYALVYVITEIKDDQFLIGTNRGLFLFSPQKGYSLISKSDNNNIKVLFTLDDQLLVGTLKGLFTYVDKGKRLVPFDSKFPSTNINHLTFYDRQKTKLWVATENDGLFLYDLKNKTYKQFGTEVLNSNSVRTLAYDNNQKLWIGTYKGLVIYDKESGLFTQIKNRSNSEGELSQNSIRKLYLDNQGGMWIGTYFGGLNYYHPLKRQIKHYKHNFSSPNNSLSDNVVGSLFEDSKGKIWIGTNDYGLNIFDPVNEQFITPSKNRALNISSVKAFVSTPNNEFWIGSYRDGLYNCKQGSYTPLPVKYNNSKNDYRIYSLATYGDTLFIGTNSGIYCYDYIKKISSPFPYTDQYKVKVASCLLVDKSKRLWIGTSDGFFCFHLPSKRFLPQTDDLQSEGYDEINCFSEDERGRVWIGSNNSLQCINPNLTKESKYSSMLTNTNIYGLIYDTSNRLWVSTCEGLFTLNLLSMQKIHFTEEDGSQGNQYMKNSFLRTRSGDFYFGGINGFNRLSPELIIDNPYTPAPVIESVLLFNKRVSPDNNLGTSYKENEVFGLSEIRIPGKYTHFGIQFSSTNFLSGERNNLFAYQLEGYEKEWSYTKKGNITYIGVPPGEYKLLIKCANSSGIWNTQPTELKVIVLPQWYQTWWARVLFILIILGVLYTSIRIYLNRKLMQQRLLSEQEKLDLFINISHELRTPLSMMISPLEEALRKGIKDRWLHKQISLVYRNSVRMLHLVNQTLDYRRAEMGAMEFKVTFGNFQLFINKICNLLRDSGERKGIEMTFTYTNMPEKIFFSSNYIERIINNLVGNAIKFTENGSIHIECSVDGNRLTIRVSDTGYGIPKDKLPLIFENFYQIEENVQGSGIGLSLVQKLVQRYNGSIEVESELGKGTTFTLTLPYKQEQFDEKDLAMDDLLNYEESSSETISSERAETLIEDSHNHIDPQEHDSLQDQEICSNKRILIVEDHEEIREYLRENFAQHQVTVAEDGQVAWEILEESPDYDLILSDVMMPRLDGITLCKRVKQNINYCHIPFILLTAKSEIKDQLKGLTLGADDYIPKPFVLGILRAKIENIFKQKARQIKQYTQNIEIPAEEITSNPMDAKLLNKATEIILKEMSNPDFSVEELGKEMGMSRSNLHSKIKSITGDTAIEYIRRIRMNEAIRFLKEGRYNMAEISTLIGFSPSYFSTSFKKFSGMLPREYQEQYRNEMKNRQEDLSDKFADKEEM